MKIIIVGCTHAGCVVASQVLKNHPTADVTIFEQNDNVSFLSCGIAVYLSGEVGDADAMFYSSPEELRQLGAHVKMKHKVLAINPKLKTVTATNLATNQTVVEHYDKLVMTTGSWPIVPKLPGVDSANVLLCKNYAHAKTLFKRAKSAKKIAVIGAGYIGVELVEAYSRQHKEVTLIDANTRVLAKYYDKVYTDHVEQQFVDHHVSLALDQQVKRFEDCENGVIVHTTKDKFKVDLAVLCIGFAPNTSLLKNHVQMLDNGAIITNEYMQSSDPDIYAAGDCAAINYNPTHQLSYIPLATNAIRQGTYVAYNLFTHSHKDMGTQASSGLMLYNTTMVATGLTLQAALAHGIDAESVTIKDNYRPEFMPSTTPVVMTLVWDKQSRRILGGQLMSKHDVSASINTLSLCIQDQHTIDYLAYVDMFFQPSFDRPFHYLNQLAQAAVAQADKVD